MTVEEAKQEYMHYMAEPVKFALQALLCRGISLREIAELINMSEHDLEEIASHIM